MSLSPTADRSRIKIQEENIVCRDCQTYAVCKDVDTRHADALEAAGWNYKRVRLQGIQLKTPVRHCTDTIFKRYAPTFANKEVLEIGGDVSSLFTIKFIRENNIRYLGIEPRSTSPGGRLPYLPRRWYFKPYNALVGRLINPITSRLYNHWQRNKQGWRAYYIRDLFPSPKLPKAPSFDVIFASSSIEHWHEDIPGSSRDTAWDGNPESLKVSVDAYSRDIRRAYDLLRPGGRLMIDCPIHVHGATLFFRGFLDEIKAVFASSPWTSITYEYWRRDFTGLRPYLPRDRQETWEKVFHQKVENLWILNVVAVK